MSNARTQRVTATDIRNGRIRFPKPSKQLFPAQKLTVQGVLRGRPFSGRYDPRTGPDRPRSAVLTVPTAVLKLAVQADEVLAVTKGAGGTYLTD